MAGLLVAVIISALLLMQAVLALAEQSATITEQEAHEIGINAYIYFYPLISMDFTRKQFTNIEPWKKFGKAPMNMFVSIPEYPPADFKGVLTQPTVCAGVLIVLACFMWHSASIFIKR